MQTIQGTLKSLKIISDKSKKENKKLVFSINNNIIEFNTNKAIHPKDGDEIIVAGLQDENNIFTAYSYKNIS